MATAASRYDMARFGMEVARFSPRQADLLLVAGTLTYKMAQVMTRLYDQMAEPKWVIAMGACASSGGMFRSYPVVQGIDEFIPVDFYIPGCPPRPDAVLNCLIQLQKKIERDRSYRLALETDKPPARWRSPRRPDRCRAAARGPAVALVTSEERFGVEGPQKVLPRGRAQGGRAEPAKPTSPVRRRRAARTGLEPRVKQSSIQYSDDGRPRASRAAARGRARAVRRRAGPSHHGGQRAS